MRWRFSKQIEENFKNSFPEYSAATLQLLSNRKLRDQKEIDEFFNPDYDEDLHSPFLLKGMDEAVKRIKKAIAAKEKIFVYGDYDADGVTSTAVVVKTLKYLGAESPGTYIPDRAKEGYGLKGEALRYIKEKGGQLVITVDCGIANAKEIDVANSLGLEVVVSDHHWVPEKIPKAAAVINPKQTGDGYPFKNLAGVGVAFKLAQALLSGQGGETSPENKRFEKWLLDLVAIGTVADSVPLLGENRTLVKYGLIVLAKTKNIGLQEIIKKAGIKTADKSCEIRDFEIPAEDTKGKNSKKGNIAGDVYQVSTDTVSFQIAPRLNAAGRMDHANTAYQLLVTETRKEAEALVNSIEAQNRSRQGITDKIVVSIRERVAKKNLGRIIMEGDGSWPVGILGLAASKICDEFSRPTIVYTRGPEESSGSGRSIESFNLIEALSQCQGILVEFGGHRGAAGFKISNKNLDIFQQRLDEIAEIIKEEDLTPSIDIDGVLDFRDFDWPLWHDLEKFAPYGEGNPEPVFAMKNLIIEEIRKVGNKEKHFKFSFKAGGDNNGGPGAKRLQAIAFNFNNFVPVLNINDNVDVAFSIIANNWNGFSKLEMRVVDIKLNSLKR